MTGADSLALADAGLRGLAIGLFLIVALTTVRQGRHRPAALLGALLSVGAAAYVICSAHHVEHRSMWFAPVLVLCTGNVVVFWLFTRAVFDDRFKPGLWHGAVWLGFVAFPIAWLLGADFIDRAPIQNGLRLAAIMLALLALVQTVKDWRGDLVEGRRRLRVFIVAAVVLHTAITATVDLSIGPEHVPFWLRTVNAAALATIAGIVAIGLLRADLEKVLSSPPAVPPPTSRADEAPADPALLARLDRLMAVDRAYREEGLTIGTLAGRLGVGERQLRRAINQGLGYRNFNDYLNRHRLADARQALADPTQAEVPILTIALDSGFSSLGPFNRAFKAETGMTPSEYRRGRSEPAVKPSPNPESASR